MADDKQDENQPSDMKASLAWGQHFAGWLVGGLAVWKLLHKLTNTTPSEWFAGLSSAYDEWRDWFMTPLDWMHLDLNGDEKNLLALATIVAGGLFRSFRRYPYLLILFLAFTAGQVVWAGFLTQHHSGFEDWVRREIGVVVGFGLLGPLASIWIDKGVRRDMSRFTLLNILFTVASGTVLLLLNWATS